MDTQHTVSVHLCSLCGKPFTQGRQLQRHESYCRKNQNRARIRPRSCKACNQAKIKCNFRAPCNQCSRKSIHCIYEQPRKEPTKSDALKAISSHGSSINIYALEPVSVSQLLGHPPREDLSEFDLSSYILGDNTDEFSAVSLTDPKMNGVTMHKELDVIGDIPATPILSSGMENFMSLLQPNGFDFTSGISTEKGMTDVPIQPWLYSSISNNEVATTAAHFSQKRIISPAQQLFTSMLIDMIRAYPLMMTRRETFPPFVHPHCYLYEGCNTLPQVLTNCMGISQLFVSRTDDTRSFLWTTIIAEVKDIMRKLDSMNKFELFSALQASLLYLIMRAIDTRPQQSAQDFELVRAHEVICDFTLQQISHSPEPEVNDPHRRWKDWIFDESIKRVAWVWFSLSVVFHIRSGNPDVPCRVADSTEGMPLPCTKTEWESQTEEGWRREYYRARNAQNTTSIQTFGDLADAHRGPPAQRAAKASQLEVWNAGIDNLGVLLNLAVYMMRS